MKKPFLPIVLIASLFLFFFSAHLAAFGSEEPEIRGDDTYVGYFIGFKEDMIRIELSRTGYPVTLPLGDDVEYLHKDNKYAAYDPDKIPSKAPVKAIEVDRRIVQVIMLWDMPR